MVLDVSNVAEVEFCAGKVAACESAACDQCLFGFFSNDSSKLCPAVLQIISDRRAIVHLLLLDVFQFFVVSKEVRVLAMKRLVSDRAIRFFQIEIREEENVEGHLAEFQIANRFIPQRFRASINAPTEHAQSGAVLPGDKFLPGFQHSPALCHWMACFGVG